MACKSARVLLRCGIALGAGWLDSMVTGCDKRRLTGGMGDARLGRASIWGGRREPGRVERGLLVCQPCVLAGTGLRWVRYACENLRGRIVVTGPLLLLLLVSLLLLLRCKRTCTLLLLLLLELRGLWGHHGIGLLGYTVAAIPVEGVHRHRHGLLLLLLLLKLGRGSEPWVETGHRKTGTPTR